MTAEPERDARRSERVERVERGEIIGAGVTWLATWSLRVALVAVGVALVVFLIGKLWVIFLPIFLALILATLLQPPVAWLRRHRFPAALAAFTVVVGALGVLVGLGVLLSPRVTAQIGTLADQVVAGIGQIQTWLAGPPLNLGTGQLGSGLQAVTDQLQQSATTVATTLLTGVTAVASGLITALLTVVLAFLFVKDGDRFLPWLRRWVGAPAGPHLDAVLRRSWRELGGFIRIQALVGLIDAVLIGTALAILGIPLTLVLAVLTFFAAFVPIVGAVVVGALAVLVALVADGLTTALIVLAVVVGVQQLEGNVLLPILQGRGLKLHPGTVLIAVTAGGALYGVAGALLAVPIAAVGGAFLRYLSEQVERRTTDPPGESGYSPEGSDS